MATKVISKYKAPMGWEQDPNYVYIGRPGPWGNPFIIGRDGDRAQVIQKYEAWFEEEFCSDIDRLHGMITALKDKTLVCFCAPQACHGDVIAQHIDCYCKEPGCFGDLTDHPDGRSSICLKCKTRQ